MSWATVEHSHGANEELATIEHDGVEADPETTLDCPACESSEVSAIPRMRLFIFLAIVVYASVYAIGQSDLAVAAVIVLGLIALFAPSHRCRACGEKWLAPGSTQRNVVPPGPEPSDTIDRLCPSCGSPEFYRIDHRRLKALPLLASVTIPPLMLALLPAFLFLPRRKCDECGFEA